MANPLDRLQSQFQLGGQTVRSSAEELQNISSATGRTAAPVQPMEAAVIGGTPSQAKMAGSSANIQKALKVSAGEKELPTYLRRLQAARPLLEEEEQRISRARSMGQLNSLEERVQAAAVAQIGTAPKTGVILKVADDNLPSTLTATQRDRARTLLSLVGKGETVDPNTQKDVYAELITLLGYGQTPDLTIDNIKKDIKEKYLTDAETEMEKAAADGMPPSLLVSQLNPQDLGFNNWAELAAILKLPPEKDLGSLTVQQLTDRIEAVQAEEYSRTSSLLRIVNDPNVGQAEKEAARQQLAQLGATGILAAEADVSNLASQIDDINTVTIAGKDYTVSELLSDSTITSLVDDYLKDPERARLIKDTAPEFAAWIDNNKRDLEKIVAKIDPGIKAVQTTIENNAKIQVVDEANKLSDGVMSALFGDKWKTSTTALDTSSYSSFFGVLKSSDPRIRQDFTSLLNSMSDRPGDIQYLAGLSQQELEQKGLLSSAGIQKYQSYLQTSSDIAGPLTKDTTTTNIVKSLFGNATDQEVIDDLVRQVKTINDTNLVDDLSPDELEILKIFDKNQDGTIDSTADILQRAQQMFSGKSLKDLANGVKDVKTGGELLSALRNKIASSTTGNRLYMAFGDVLADGKVGDDEIANPIIQDANITDLQALIDKGVPGASKLQSLIKEKAVQQASAIRGSSEVNISPSDMDATFDNPWHGTVTMLDTADRLKAYISSAKFDSLPPAVRTELYASYDKLVGRAVEENDKWIQSNMRRQFDREISQPGSALDREIASYETKLRAGPPSKWQQYEKDRWIAGVQAQLNDAKERQRQLDAQVPAITDRIMNEGRAKYKSPRLESMKGWRK